VNQKKQSTLREASSITEITVNNEADQIGRQSPGDAWLDY